MIQPRDPITVRCPECGARHELTAGDYIRAMTTAALAGPRAFRCQRVIAGITCTVRLDRMPIIGMETTA